MEDQTKDLMINNRDKRVLLKEDKMIQDKDRVKEVHLKVGQGINSLNSNNSNNNPSKIKSSSNRRRVPGTNKMLQGDSRLISNLFIHL